MARTTAAPLDPTCLAPGAAAEAGLQPGDVIVELNREGVASPEEFRKRLGRVDKKRNVLLLVHRGGNTFFVVLSPRR